jgi:1-acyl-sn-glycerol-3-phosphate acyltransferase
VDQASVESLVAELVREISDREVGPDDSIGLDSLAHAELALAIEERFGVWPPDAAASTTVEEVARGVLERLPVRGRTSPIRPGIGSIIGLGEIVMRPLLDGYYRLRVEGADRIPGHGPVILVSNHDSFVDIPLLAVVTSRPVWFMAREELFRSAFGRWFFHALGGFPVRRDLNDLASIRAGLAVLRWGRMLGMYPEGTRSTQLLPFLAGSAWMALVTGAPLVPVRMLGTRESMPPGSLWPRPSEVHVLFGETILPGRERNPRTRLARAREITEELRAVVARLD